MNVFRVVLEILTRMLPELMKRLVDPDERTLNERLKRLRNLKAIGEIAVWADYCSEGVVKASCRQEFRKADYKEQKKVKVSNKLASDAAILITFGGMYAVSLLFIQETDMLLKGVQNAQQLKWAYVAFFSIQLVAAVVSWF